MTQPQFDDGYFVRKMFILAEVEINLIKPILNCLYYSEGEAENNLLAVIMPAAKEKHFVILPYYLNELKSRSEDRKEFFKSQKERITEKYKNSAVI